MATLYTIGSGAWTPAKRIDGLLAGLESAGVTTLIDTRHSPCASTTSPKSNYGPKPWNLQVSGGITHVLKRHGIRYVWLVELGNPQRNDPTMRVLKRHLADQAGSWPVHRGLEHLARMVHEQPESCCIMCACKKYEECHRRVIAEALRARHFDGDLSIANIGPRGVSNV